MREELSSFDIGAVAASIALFAGYHINLYIVKPQCFGGKVPFAINMKNADMWIMKHKEMSDSPTMVLAIQTLRNTMMAAVFIGGNAVNFAYDLANDYNNVKEKPMQLRSMVIMILMFSSFLCWANVIRLCSVLGYLIGTMQYSEKLRAEACDRTQKDETAKAKEVAETQTLDEANESSLEIEHVGAMEATDTSAPRKRNAPAGTGTAHGHRPKFSIDKEQCSAEDIPNIFEEGSKIMKMMTVYFSFGFRLMFVSIPFAFYSAGPLPLVIASACLFLFLRSYDFTRHHSVMK